SAVVTATDYDGDTATKSIDIGKQIQFRDDAPVLKSVGSVSLSEDDLANGSSPDNAHLSVKGDLDISLGADGGKVVLAADGAKWDDASKTLTADDSSWKVTLGNDGKYTFTLMSNTAHTGASAENLKIAVTYTATDGDGDAITGKFDVTIKDDVPTINGTAQNVNLLSNGDFTGGTWANTASWGAWATESTGWKIEGTAPGQTGVQLEKIVGPYFGLASSNGHPMVDLGASPGNIAISQNVAGLTAGDKYTISFEVGSYDPNSSSLEVRWNNEVYTIPVTGAMKTVTLDVIAGSGNNTLTFKEVGFADDNTGTYLANISLTHGAAVPVFTGTAVEDSGVVTFNLSEGKDFSFGADTKGSVSFDASHVTISTPSGTTITLDPSAYKYNSATGVFTITPGYKFDGLSEGEVATITVPFSVTDGDGDSKSAVYQLTVTGKNDAPVAVADAVSVNEDGAAAASTRATGVLGNDTDVDSGDTAKLVVSAAGVGANGLLTSLSGDVGLSLQGKYGTLTINKDGTYSYSPDNGEAQKLGEGAQASDVFTYTAKDTNGATSNATLTFNIIGQNDAPTVSGAVTANATEDGAPVALSALANAGDVDSGSILSVILPVGGLPAGVTYDSTTQKFILDPRNEAYQSLAAGETKVVTVNYDVSDGTAKTAASAAWTITGTNDVAVITAASGADLSVTEESDKFAGGKLDIVDVDNGQQAFAAQTDSAGTYGKFSIGTDGTWSYVADNSKLQSLAANEHKTEDFTVWSKDGSASHVVTITVTGTNDPAVIGPLGTSSVTEDQNVTTGGNLTATGQIAISDADAGQGAFKTTVTDVGQNLGTLTLGSDGTYTYSVSNAAVQYLNSGQSKLETFAIQSVDGTTQQVTFTINGADDNVAPVLTLSNDAYVLDQFNQQGYNGNDGTASWKTGWTETGEPTNPKGGDIQVVPSGNGNAMILTDDDWGVDNGDAAQRSVDLTGATQATLTFDYKRDGLEYGDNIKVQVLVGNNWVDVATVGNSTSYHGSVTDSVFQNMTVDLTKYISANTTVRFLADDTLDQRDAVYIDNVKVSYSTTPTFTEGGAETAITMNASIADSDANMQAAKVVLTNWKAGDVLSVNGKNGSTGMIGTIAFSITNDTIAFTGNASRAAYEAAIAAIRFANTSEDPDVSNRTFEITVNDGLANSNTVVATVAVVAVNDAPVAGADSIITNAGTGGTFVVPEWALLANDRDVDSSTLDVTATTSNSSMTTSLLPNPGSVTVTDGVPSGGNFNYTVSDGSTTGTGSVSVTQRTTGSLDGTGNADILIAKSLPSTPQITTLTFAASYDAGDKVSVTVNGTTYSYTVAAGGQTAEQVYDALKTVSVGGVTLASSLAAEGVTWAKNLDGGNAVTLTSAPGVNNAFDIATAIDNGSDVGKPWTYRVDFSSPKNFDSNDVVKITINGTEYSSSGTNDDWWSSSRFDSAQEKLAKVLTAAGFKVSLDTGTDAFDITTTDSAEVSGRIVINGHAGSVVSSTVVTPGTLPTDQPAPTVATTQHASDNAVIMNGLGGNDILIGSSAGDTLVGGAGNDILFGGAGNDIYKWGSELLTSGNADTIRDYATNERIDVSSLLGNVQSLAGYVKVVVVGNDLSVRIDQNGGGDSYVEAYKLLGAAAGGVASVNVYFGGADHAIAQAAWTQNAIDPIILDLDRNGVALTTLDNGVSFDINADGIQDKIAWTAGTDGILAYDVDGNGKIDNGTEIFSPKFAGGSYADGLQALATLDSNQDGKIDANDEAFAKLSIWQDLNHNGISDAGELSSLADHQIASLSLDAQALDGAINGQSVLAEGSYTLTDGSTGQFLEVAFDTTLGGSSTTGNDSHAYSLVGGDGNDTLSGAGGMVTMTGGAGADTFVLDAGALSDVKMADVITDYKAGEGDTLDVSKLLDSLLGHQATEAEALASVRTMTSGADTVVSVNANGGWQDVAVLQNTQEAVKILFDDKQDSTTAPHVG
ncbi:VCBS domain-containing protein, partial [Rhizobium metallidurans]